ncbi:MAG: hypothetical protein JRH07_14060 [Deltaproteobacteria bacterium]|nr:hypothetical protein [Deltaproteobacteria bacterium]
MPVEAVEARVERALTQAFLNLEKYLRDLLKKIHKKEGVLVSDSFNITRLDNTLRSLRVEMDALGYREVILQQLAGLEQLHYEILDKAKKMKLPAEFSRESQQAITMLLSGAEAELMAVADQAAEEISQLLRRAILGGGDVADLLTSISEKLGTKRHQAMTLIVTSLQAFNRTLTMRHAEEAGVEWFVYLGPQDSITREWCSHWVGRRGTKEDFEATASRWGHQKQPTPVITWGGGWNCRHEFVPLVGDAVKKYPKGPR